MNMTYLILAFVSLFGYGLADSGRGPVFPDFLAQYHLNSTVGSLFYILSSAFVIVNNLFTRWWLTALGPYRSMQMYLAIHIVCLVTIGLSQELWHVWVGICLLGIAMGGQGIVQNVLTAQGAPGHLTRAYAGLQSMYGLSSFLAPLLASAVYAFHLPWRYVFLCAALVPFGNLLYSFRSSPAKAASSRRHEPAPPMTPQALRAVVWLALMMTVYVMAEILTSSRMVLYERSVFGVSPETANFHLTLFFGGLLFGRLVVATGRLKMTNIQILRVGTGLSLITFTAGLCLHPLFFALTGLSFSAMFPCGLAYMSENFGKQSDRATAWIYSFNSLGLIAMQYGVGWATDTFGLRAALSSGLGFLIVLAILLIKPPGSLIDAPPVIDEFSLGRP